MKKLLPLHTLHSSFFIYNYAFFLDEIAKTE